MTHTQNWSHFLNHFATWWFSTSTKQKTKKSFAPKIVGKVHWIHLTQAMTTLFKRLSYTTPPYWILALQLDWLFACLFFFSLLLLTVTNSQGRIGFWLKKYSVKLIEKKIIRHEWIAIDEYYETNEWKKNAKRKKNQ